VSVILVAQAKPIFTHTEQVEVSPSDIKNLVYAYLEGFEYEQYINSTAQCQKETSKMYDFGAEAVENFANKNNLKGFYSIADLLAELSPSSRTCYQTYNEIYTDFSGYWKNFSGIKDFFSKIAINAMSHIKPIKKDGTVILTEFLTSKNYTNVAFLSGELTSLIFILEEEMTTPVSHSDTDPLGPSPIGSETLWIVFEGIYKFLVNSKLAAQPDVLKCQEGTLNMALLDEKAYELYRKGDNKNAWFTFTDSLTFTHDIVDGCYHTGKETLNSISNIRKQGQISKNLLHNLYFVVSGLAGAWSQIYHRDWLNLIGVLGGLTYRVFVYGSN
jgi:hypothetical protein